MKEITDTKEIQEIEFQILVKIHDFCEKHKLRYSICGGTLLGAIRHKGFIPWDDDIDIFMPRPDYDRFCREFYAEGVSLHDHENDCNYAYPFAKVYDDRTVLREDVYPKICAGIYVDVFPVDGFSSKERAARAFKIRCLISRIITYKQLPLWRKGRAFYKTAALWGIRAFSRLFPNRFFLRIIRKRLMADKFEESPIVANLWGHWTRECLPREVFSSFVDVDFEGKKFKSIVGWDTYLRQLYGDYMQLPPPEERKRTHLFTAWWK